MEPAAARTRQSNHAVWRIGLLVTAVLSCTAGSAFGQVTNEILVIDPNSAPQGTVGLTVTFTLDTDAPPAPPAGIMPDSVTIGTMTGTSVTHSAQYTVTAVFDISAGEPAGAKDASIVFSIPNGTLTFSMVGGFTVTSGADMPPSIAQHPVSQTVPPGSSVSFSVVAGGTPPLSYQWQKDTVDIVGATDASYTINPVDYPDAGNYRCVVTNDFGTTTSDEAVLTVAELPAAAYPIVDTNQSSCYDTATNITCPAAGLAFHGQDAQYDGNAPSYALSGDGLTVYDNVTGLTWQRSPDTDGDGLIDAADKLTWTEAQAYPATLNAVAFGGYDDWRLPTIKELYSLIDFTGMDPSACNTEAECPGLVPFIDTNYFDFAYGDVSAGERVIDSQYASSTVYVSDADGGLLFGVNFADGRIKGYWYDFFPYKTFLVMCVRGNADYGVNNFVDNGDGTITDLATGLMWMQDDSGSGMFWEDALDYAENLSFAGHDDWRLPNVKELQSILDYTRSPDTTGSAAIDPLFNVTTITNEESVLDYPYYWSATTHIRYTDFGDAGAYVAFGRGLGYWNGQWQDVHGAGCQRSDPKIGDPADYPYGHGPQGDAIRIYNFVRPVRDADLTAPYAGYNLFTSLNSTTAYLMDNDGTFVHSWNTGYRPGNAMYFLETGELLHTGSVINATFNAGGAGGIVQTFDWDGNVTWSYEYSSTTHLQHHDVEMLPNGHVLLVAWQYKSQAEAVAAGRDPSLLIDGELWPDSVIEVAPTGPTTGDIVWEWHAWDHLVQDYDPTKDNYGVVADHPELIDLNYVQNGGADWNHVNSVDYNADLDQIVLSVHNFGEIWVIDHSTTSAEAAGHTGGSSGMGGDLIYRWGNPMTYGAGTAGDQQLFGQHDAEWIEVGLPGAGDIIVFNNGMGRPGGNYSSVDEIVPPVNPDGTYTLTPGSAYGPGSATWTYTAPTPTDFFSQNISGQQRLPNGNTLICDGPGAYFFEVSTSGDTLWDYTYAGQVFRVERYAASYPGFDGTPLDDQPVDCFVDADCDDNAFCTGIETCVGGACLSGSNPCPGELCDEATDTCMPMPDAARPMPDDQFEFDGTTRICSVAADCLVGLSASSEVSCVLAPQGDGGPGSCYVHRNRYVSIDPNPDNAGILTARRVKLATGEVLGWVGAPIEVPVSGAEVSPQLQSRIETVPHYRDWSVDDLGTPWADATVHVGDCEVSPGRTYVIQAITSGQDEADEANYSEALALDTVVAFGDVIGSSSGLPPDTVRNFKDVSAVVRGFQSIQAEPKVWLDLQGGTATPEIPDFSDINFGDINQAVAGFQGGAYPFAAPCDCPGQTCR